jgi:hypothetical protein
MIPPPTYISFQHHHITLCKGGGYHCRGEGREKAIRCSDNNEKHFEVSENISFSREFETVLC